MAVIVNGRMFVNLQTVAIKNFVSKQLPCIYRTE